MVNAVAKLQITVAVDRTTGMMGVVDLAELVNQADQLVQRMMQATKAFVNNGRKIISQKLADGCVCIDYDMLAPLYRNQILRSAVRVVEN